MEWITKLSNSIDYLENNLSGEISYNEAARIACCSTFYYQRMFSYITGITISEYIRKRRMTQAAFDIQSTNIKISDIALKYGYSSPTAFNRAFQSVHGISPISARKNNVVLNAYPPINFKITVSGGKGMKYRIVTKESFRIVGFSVPLEKEIDKNQKIVPAFWDDMWKKNNIKKIMELSEERNKTLLGINIYKNPQYISYLIATKTSKSVPKDMSEYIIPAATWVVLECDGKYPESIQSMYHQFLTEWLPFSGYKYAELPDIEIYPYDSERPKGGHSEIWIGIEKE